MRLIRTAGVNKNLGQTSRTARSDFPVHALTEVDDTRPDSEPPALITETVLSGVEGEGRDVIWVGTVTDEATCRMGVQADHEEESQMVGVPKGLEALLADLVVRSAVHQDHDEEHEVARDTTSLGVVDVQCNFGTNLWKEA